MSTLLVWKDLFCCLLRSHPAEFRTLLRIGAIPIFLILTDERYTDALIIFILAGVTDSLDGALARLTNPHTALGAFIDPLADKLLLVSSFCPGVSWVYPVLAAILVISRDVIILQGLRGYFITGHSIVVRPTLVGKVSTFFQLLTVTLTLVRLHNAAWQFPFLWQGTLALAGGAVTVSGFQYLSRALWWLNQQDEDEWRPAGEPRREKRDENQQRHSA
jgi:cardiolipin synthase